MTDRIDQYLEGRIDRDALNPDERADADAASHAIDVARTFLAQRCTPDVVASVMERVGASQPLPRTEHDSLVRRIAAAIWQPRQLSIRPVYAALAIAVCVALLWALPRQRGPVAEPPAGVSATARVFVQFRLENVDASRVQLAGSFTNWQPRYELHQSAPGVWTTMVPLGEGVHDYAFVVDGQRWIADPYAAQISDGFGGTNSRMTLLLSEAPRL